LPSFYSPELTQFSDQVTLCDEEFHHLAHVMRCKTGDQIKLNSGKGLLAYGEVLRLDKKQAIIRIKSIIPSRCNPDGLNGSPAISTRFAIAFGLLKNKHDHLLVEKITELGVTDIFPLTTRYSVRNPSENTLTKFQQAALAAIKQCDNPFLPVVHPIQALSSALQHISSVGYKIVIASEQKPELWIADLAPEAAYCFVIGPEGGFSPEEFLLFQEMQALEVSLSPLILRAETAAITAAAQFNLWCR
jgi:16S rRNA (uracil1498-N3)-methyltransferase